MKLELMGVCLASLWSGVCTGDIDLILFYHSKASFPLLPTSPRTSDHQSTSAALSDHTALRMWRKEQDETQQETRPNPKVEDLTSDSNSADDQIRDV